MVGCSRRMSLNSRHAAPGQTKLGVNRKSEIARWSGTETFGRPAPGLLPPRLGRVEFVSVIGLAPKIGIRFGVR